MYPQGNSQLLVLNFPCKDAGIEGRFLLLRTSSSVRSTKNAWPIGQVFHRGSVCLFPFLVALAFCLV